MSREIEYTCEICTSTSKNEYDNAYEIYIKEDGNGEQYRDVCRRCVDIMSVLFKLLRDTEGRKAHGDSFSKTILKLAENLAEEEGILSARPTIESMMFEEDDIPF